MVPPTVAPTAQTSLGPLPETATRPIPPPAAPAPQQATRNQAAPFQCNVVAAPPSAPTAQTSVEPLPQTAVRAAAAARRRRHRRPGRPVEVDDGRRAADGPDVVAAAGPDSGERAGAGGEGRPAAAVEVARRDFLEVAFDDPDVVVRRRPDAGVGRIGQTEGARAERAGDGPGAAPASVGTSAGVAARIDGRAVAGMFARSSGGTVPSQAAVSKIAAQGASIASTPASARLS